jgi:hypothetical protein
MMTTDADWPFPDVRNVAVFTSERVVSGEEWIHYVTHDAEDGAWQFHPHSGITSKDETSVVALATVVNLDETVRQLADLPLGWHAWRDSPGEEWQRAAMI